MKIEGTVKKIERAMIPPPMDGVHCLGKDGTIKGSRSLYINDTFVPHGQVGFYWQKGDIGYKVYWSFAHKYASKKRAVHKTFRFMKKLSKKGLCPKVYKIKYIKLVLDGKKHHAYAIKMDHVCYPKEAWVKFANGYPYDWNCLDQVEHPTHNALGYNEFNRKIGRNMKLGDVIYCTKKKRWYLVDCD